MGIVGIALLSARNISIYDARTTRMNISSNIALKQTTIRGGGGIFDHISISHGLTDNLSDLVLLPFLISQPQSALPSAGDDDRTLSLPPVLDLAYIH